MTNELTPVKMKTGPTQRRLIVLAMFNSTAILTGIASFVHGASSYRASTQGLIYGRWICLAIALFYLTYPFFTENYWKRHPESLTSKGKHPREAMFLIGTSSAASPVIIAFVYAAIGGPITGIYWASAVSLISLFFWTWRYRDMLYESAGNDRLA